MKLQTLFFISLGVTLACGPSVATTGDGSTGAGDSTTASSDSIGTASSAPPNPTTPPNPPPQTTTDPYVPTTGDTSSSSGSGCGFVCGDVPGGSGFDCDIFTQADCPRGEKCAPWANDGGSVWNATRCYPIDDDPDQPGEPCTIEGAPASGLDSCDLGSMCWDVDAKTEVGVCTPHCSGSPGAPECDDPTSVCEIGGDSVLALCLPTCDPLAASCEEGEGCYPVDSSFFCRPDASGKGGAPFEACEFADACDPGSACVPGEAAAVCDSTSCCSPFCSLQTPDCPDAMVCFPWYGEDARPPGDDIGYCADAGWDGG